MLAHRARLLYDNHGFLPHFLGTDEICKVYSVDLRYEPICDGDLAPLAALDDLEILRLNETLITDGGLQHVRQIKGLRSLSLWDTRVTDAMTLMTTYRVRHLPVIDDGAMSGVISIGDLTSWVVRDQRRHIEDLHDYIRAA